MSGSEPIDMHELRMSIGTATMAMSDALDQDVFQLVDEARVPAMRAFRRLVDNGMAPSVAAYMMVGFLMRALEEERGEP